MGGMAALIVTLEPTSNKREARERMHAISDDLCAAMSGRTPTPDEVEYITPLRDALFDSIDAAAERWAQQLKPKPPVA